MYVKADIVTFFGHSKVGKYQEVFRFVVWIFFDEDIFSLDVSVEYAHIVHCLKCMGQLSKIVDGNGVIAMYKVVLFKGLPEISQGVVLIEYVVLGFIWIKIKYVDNEGRFAWLLDGLIDIEFDACVFPHHDVSLIL